MELNLSTACDQTHILINNYLKKFYLNDASAPYLNKEISLYIDNCRYSKDDIRPLLVKLGYSIIKKTRSYTYATHAMAAIHLLLLSAIPIDDIVDCPDNQKYLRTRKVSMHTSLAYSLSTKMREDARLILLRRYKSLPSILRIMEIISRFLEVQDASHTLEVHSQSNIPFSEYTLDDYLFLIDQATARFVAESFVIGGLLGKVDKKTENIMRDFGIQLGRLCQIRDDYLDYICVQTTGKLPFSDLYGKRKRFPLLSIFWFGNKNQTREASQVLSKKEISDSDIYNIVEIISENKVRQQSLQIIKNIEQQAVRKLCLLPRYNHSYDTLSEIVDLFAMKS